MVTYNEMLHEIYEHYPTTFRLQDKPNDTSKVKINHCLP